MLTEVIRNMNLEDRKLIKVIFLSIFIQISLSACTTIPISKQFVELNKKELCCSSISEFDYKEVVLDKEVEVTFDTNSPVHQFGEHKSYFSAYKLPAEDEYYFYVKSYFNGTGIEQYFRPVFILLNEDFKVIRSFTLNMEFVRPGWVENAHMASAFKPGSTKASYMIIFTAKFKDDAPVVHIEGSSLVTMVGNVPVVTSTPGMRKGLIRSPTGSLRLEAIKIKNED